MYGLMLLYLLLLCGFCCGSMNIAFQRPAIQSSILIDPSNGNIYHGPERAVDNNTLGRFKFYLTDIHGEGGNGTCCHTNTSQPYPVYWEVDLGNVSIITRIVIQYRDTYPDRFDGYIIKVSDQSLGNGKICYRDTEPGFPPTYVTHDCTVIGRYVRYENNVGYAELCNFEAYGCPVNYYGNNCTIPCSSNCLYPPCNPDNGICIGGCQPGYKGNQCYQGCDDGTFGMNCSYQCNNCRSEFCNISTGICSSGCKKGFYGLSCNETCKSGQFGYDCTSKCHCVGTECDIVSGSCVTGICFPGWTLQSCSQKCQSNTFGQDCRESCGNCRDGETCDHVTGFCQNGCVDGWTGVYCNISCSPGMYGFKCSKCCGHCFNSTCNHVDGNCDSCDFGYHGARCDMSDTSDSTSDVNLVLVGGIIVLGLLQAGELIVLLILYRKGVIMFRSQKKEKVYGDTTKSKPDNCHIIYSTTMEGNENDYVYCTTKEDYDKDHVYSTTKGDNDNDHVYSTTKGDNGEDRYSSL